MLRKYVNRGKLRFFLFLFCLFVRLSKKKDKGLQNGKPLFFALSLFLSIFYFSLYFFCHQFFFVRKQTTVLRQQSCLAFFLNLLLALVARVLCGLAGSCDPAVFKKKKN